ncbi:MAG: phosphatase PAP2 family protein [Planctomycetaceae bacterium]
MTGPQLPTDRTAGTAVARRSWMVAIAGAIVFLATFVLMSQGLVESWDLESVEFFRDSEGNLTGSRLPHIVRDITTLGGWTFLAWMTLCTSTALASCGRKSEAPQLALTVIGAVALTYALKNGIGRSRPAYGIAIGITSKAFPSGHAMVATVFYPTVAAILWRFVDRRGLKYLLIVNAIGPPLMIGASRVYLGVHYATDVIAGWALGVAWGTLCWNWFGRNRMSNNNANGSIG